MKRGSEKSGLRFRTRDAVRPVLDVLAVASVAAALVGAALAAGGASWRVRAYFSIVGALFDILFAACFFIDAQRPGARFPWLDGLSSIVPLTFFSGPFLAGWVLGDLGAAAVRGFWLGARPAGAFAVLAALRLLRAARPWTGGRARSSGDSDVYADSAAAARSVGRRAAAAAGVIAVLAGAFASEAFLLPGFARAAHEARVAAVSTILAIPEDGERVTAAMAAGAAALRVHGRALLAAPPGASPADYAAVSAGGVEAWFPVAGEIRARGTASAIAALASLAAAAGYAAAILALGRVRPARTAGSGARAGDGGDARRNRPSAMPSGKEELAGILGKRAP